MGAGIGGVTEEWDLFQMRNDVYSANACQCFVKKYIYIYITSFTSHKDSVREVLYYPYFTENKIVCRGVKLRHPARKC